METKLPTPQELRIVPCNSDRQEALSRLRREIRDTPLPLPGPLRNAAEATLRELVCMHRNPVECWLPFSEQSRETILAKTERPWKGLCVTAFETFYVAEGEGLEDELGVVSELCDGDFACVYLEAMPERLPAGLKVWTPACGPGNRVRLNRAEDAEPLDVYLDERRTPVAWKRKYDELTGQGLSDGEAREILSQPFELELYYSDGHGLFAVEREAVGCGVIFDPCTAGECLPCEGD